MNPLMAWVKERGDVELVAPSYPGRDRTREMKPYESALALSAEALRVFHGKLSDGVPFAFWGHSVGTWVAFELLVLMRRVGLPMPEVALMNAFVAPHMPEDLRPWRCSRELNDVDMKTEIVRWDPAHFDGVAKAIFDEPTWSKTWLPLMRADFKLFDEYQFTHDGMPKFNFPISAFHFSEEVLCRSEMVRMWEDWTSSEFTFEEFEGKGFGHLSSMYSPSNKNAYFSKATAILERFVP
jgi:medium-chain acyl-[acyl-carrier-protein] hydrolase